VKDQFAREAGEGARGEGTRGEGGKKGGHQAIEVTEQLA
jgi:hypothetical protein